MGEIKDYHVIMFDFITPRVLPEPLNVDAMEFKPYKDFLGRYVEYAYFYIDRENCEIYARQLHDYKYYKTFHPGFLMPKKCNMKINHVGIEYSMQLDFTNPDKRMVVIDGHAYNIFDANLIAVAAILNLPDFKTFKLGYALKYALV